MSYASVVTEDAPKGYWRLGETSGTSAADSSGNTQTGTYIGTPTLGVAGALAGDANTAITLNGTTQWVSVADSTTLDLGDTFTYECWFKRAGTGLTDCLIDKGSGAAILRFNGSDKLLFRRNSFLDLATSTVTITDTNWHHVVVIKNGATVKIYIDGTDCTGTVTNSTCANTAIALGIGASDAGTGDFFRGSIDEVAIYGTALSAARVKVHYEAGLTNTVTAVPAIASATAPSPVPTASISPPAAVATTSALAPTPSIEIGPPAAGATASAPAPSIIARSPSVIQFRAQKTNSVSASSPTSLVITKPTGTVDDDVMLASIRVGSVGSPSVTPPAGWTALESSSSLFTYWKLAESEPANYTFAITGTGTVSAMGGIASFLGADTLQPIDVSGKGNGSSTTPVAPSVTTAVDGGLVVCAAGVGGVHDVTLPDDMSQGWFDTGGSVSGTVSVAYDDLGVGKGATGVRTFTADDSVTWEAHTVALLPPSGNAQIKAVAATATASAPAPAVTVDRSITSPAAEATASASAPTISVEQSVSITAPAAEASAVALSPFLIADQVVPERQKVPPQVHDPLSIAVSRAGKTIARWGSDESNPENVPMGVQFSTSVPGGFKDCTISLPRPIEKDYSDLQLFDDIQILGKGGEVRWEGRIMGLPRSHSSSFAITIQAVGWSSHLTDDKSFQEIYIDRDISPFTEPSAQRRINVLGTTIYSFTGASVRQGFESASGASASLLVEFSTYGSLNDIAEQWWYGNGVDIGEVRYDFIVPKTGGDPTKQINVMNLATDDTAGTATGSSNYFTTPASNQSLSAPGAGYKHVWMQSVFAGAFTGTSAGDTYGWSNFRFLGRHGLSTTGTAPNEGLLASDVVANAVGRAAPLLNYTTGTDGSIQTSTYPIPHITFKEPTDAASVVLAANNYHLWDWGVWEDRLFWFQPTSPETATNWLAHRSDGIDVNLEGDDASNVFNAVIVRYTTTDGKSRSVGPPGTNTDVTSSALLDTSPYNPVNVAGIPIRCSVLDISQVTTQANAIYFGQIWLAEAALPQYRGSVTFRGAAYHDTRGRVPCSKVRAGHYVRLSDQPASLPRKIIETAYSTDGGGQTTCTVDNTVFKLNALFERIGISLVGSGI